MCEYFKIFISIYLTSLHKPVLCLPKVAKQVAPLLIYSELSAVFKLTFMQSDLSSQILLPLAMLNELSCIDVMPTSNFQPFC